MRVFRFVFLLMLFLAVLFLAACAPRQARLAGRVVRDGRPVAGAQVRVKALDAARPTTALTGPDGRFRVEGLPPGAYRVEARTRGTPPLAAVPGQNPLYLPPGAEVWVGLQAVPVIAPRYRPAPDVAPGFGALSGRVLYRDRPVEGAVVTLYLDESGGLRGPGVRRSLPTGPDGFYAFDELLEGRYYVVARKRLHEGGEGPVREGDLYGIAPANPVGIRAGQETVLDLYVVRKERDLPPDAGRLALTGTGIRGRVVDGRGRPVAGVYVFAYRNRVIGHGMPDFRTLPTGPDGTFELPLGEGGLFYVGARERSGGSPVPGEWFGFYEGSPDHGIEVPRGRVVEGVEIVVRRVLSR